MEEDSEETGKTVRTSLESLVINVTNDELKYRYKYLPDPKRLSNDKIVCTVCSVSLASRVRKGKSIYVHAILGVLVCKDCHKFYGDGIFSTDEDGEDKYCRWCGQGGTLYLCSKCNCGFCKKCMMKNMKNSALAEIEKDNWKCLVCYPRPIFGSRAVCWASQELNNNTRKNELVKHRLEKEKSRLAGESQISDEEKESQCIESTDKRGSTRKKRVRDSEDSDSSTVFIPAKKLKENPKSNKSLNGSVKKHRRKKENSSTDNESSDDDHSSKWEKRKRKKRSKRHSLSSENSSSTFKKKKKKLKNKSNTSSEESADDIEIVPKSSKKKDNKSYNTKRKRKSSRRKDESLSDSSSNDSSEKERKKKLKKSKGKSVGETSSSEDTRKSENEEKSEIIPRIDNIGDSNDGRECGAPNNISKTNSNEVVSVKLKQTGNELEDNISAETKSSSSGKLEVENGEKTSRTEILLCSDDQDFMNKLQTLESIDEQKFSGELESSQQNQPLDEDEYTLSYHESSSNTDEKLSLSQEDEVNVKVHLAIEWLDGVSNDIADLGNLISERTKKFGEKKISMEKLNSYEDVLSVLGKLKQLLGGIHTNYKQIENSLEDKLISWKILAGLEKSDLELFDEEGEIQGEGEVETGDGILAEEEIQADGDIQVESDLQAECDLQTVGDLQTVNDVQAEGDLQAEGDHQAEGDLQAEGDHQTEGNIHIEGDVQADSDIQNDSIELQSKNILNSHSESDKDISEFGPEVRPDSSGFNSAPSIETENALTNDRQENETQDSEDKNIHIEEVQDVLKINDNECDKPEIEPTTCPSNDTVSEDTVKVNEGTHDQELECEDAIIKAELNLRSGSSNFIWSGLLSSDSDSDLNEEISVNLNCNSNNATLTEDNQEQELGISDVKESTQNHMLDSETDNETSLDKKESNKDNECDAANYEALQELLDSSSDPDVKGSESSSDDSDDIPLDDSDLDHILKPTKVVVKKTKKKEKKVKEEISENLKTKIDEDEEKEEEGKDQKKDSEKKTEEPIDSEAEIDMLTDLSKLKKKTVLRRVEEESSERSSSEESQEDDGQSEKKKRKKYNTEIKKRREQERNELFGFLQGDSSAEDEVDITKDDLDVMENQYVSESSDSMTLETFSRKMNEKWQELEKEQDQLNLQMLLASESEEGSVGGEDLVLDSNDEEKKKKKKEKKIKEEKVNEDEPTEEKEETEVKVKEENEEDKEGEVNNQTEPDKEYEQFVKDLAKSRTTFTGIGSSSEEDKDEDEEEIEVKEEPLSDHESKVKKEPKASDDEGSSDSNSSSDVFLDINKKKSEKKPLWRHHKLLRMKLTDTDTSDEERWWQRRLEREKKKKEQGDSSKKSNSHPKIKKEENGSDKENKKIKKKKEKDDEEANSSSTLEMSSTESSGSEVFEKKKKKKKGSSDSDLIILSDTDKKKKKKKKKFNLSGDESDDSEDSDDDVIDITQKSSQGESPGKGGRKNIRKVLTKHELAAATKAAAKEEEERKKRIAARQKLFNEMFEIKEAEILEKLVLDFDPETKTELISVDKDLVTKMKPHQAKGVKFMWDSCFESLAQLKTKKGSGCILAHCMGLGKTFQVVSLVHTILTHKDTNVRTVLVVCPLSTVLNWFNEFDKWLEDVSGGRNIKIYHLTKFKKAHERSRQLSLWHRTGGVMILGYEMFRILANPSTKKYRLMHMEVFQKTLIDPGADLVVCDEGHMLKNESTVLSKAMSRIRTLRRIVLTGTPMQNNLKEYHCMVQFVKPNLLGTRKEFLNQFVNPITNGQFVDSTEADVKVMKRRAHVLHKMLEGLVQRFDYSVLMPFLPPKHEYVISLRLSDVQVKMYQLYLDYFCQKKSDDKRTSSQLFQDWQVLGRIWTHPRVVKMSTDKAEKEKQGTSDSEEDKKKLRSQKSIKDFFKKKVNSSSSDSSKHESEDEGSIKDFINDKSSSSSLSLSSSNSSSSEDENGEKKEKVKKKKKSKKSKDGKEPEKKENPEVPKVEAVDEINLISSEEEGGDKKEEVKESQETDTNNDNEEKVNDSGIEDQEGKTGDEPNAAEETASKVESDKAEKESKEEEKLDKDEKSEKEKKKSEGEHLERRGSWWKDIVEQEHLEDINQSAKLVVLFAILRECEMIGDKVLVFSQSLFSLDLIEYFLEKVDRATEENRLDESLGNHAGCWQKGLDYFRLDGSSSSESRSAWCKSFNRDDNPRARLFLISTRAGGLGINLTGANRVVIFDASWNPSHDVQSIFRVFRFGQKKPCYVYRFIAHGTMEEKVYDRQVAKQSLSSRVVDEQQVHRHFSMNDLNELYNFTPPVERTEKPTPVFPKDMLMAELFKHHNHWIEKYHEHDSLLENIAEEELNEEERKLAWEDYENEKKRGFSTPFPGTGGATNFPGMANQIELFKKSLRLKPFDDKSCVSASDTSISDPFWSSPSSDTPTSEPIWSSPSSDTSTLEPFWCSPSSDSEDSASLALSIAKDVFPNATDAEMNAMLQTLMYQVNYRVVSQQVGGQQQQAQQGGAGPSQQQQNFRAMNSNNMATAQQMFNTQRNHLYQKYGTQLTQQQRVGNNQMNQQRIGNGQMNQQRIGNRQITQQRMGNGQMNQQRIGNAQMNQQRIGNAQIRQGNKTVQENYMEQMRKQQEVNLARIQMQRRFQQQQSSNTTQQGNAMGNRRQHQPNTQFSVGFNRQLQQQPQNRAQRAQNFWKPNQPQAVNSNQLQQVQKQQQNPINILSKRKQLQITPVASPAKPVATNPQRPVLNSPQEQMRQRISELQRKKNQQALQQNIQQRTQKTSSLDLAQQRQLEAMKKRYKESRMKQSLGGGSQPISIVEIDDEPGT